MGMETSRLHMEHIYSRETVHTPRVTAHMNRPQHMIIYIWDSKRSPVDCKSE